MPFRSLRLAVYRLRRLASIQLASHMGDATWARRAVILPALTLLDGMDTCAAQTVRQTHFKTHSDGTAEDAHMLPLAGLLLPLGLSLGKLATKYANSCTVPDAVMFCLWSAGLTSSTCSVHHLLAANLDTFSRAPLQNRDACNTPRVEVLLLSTYSGTQRAQSVW